LKGLRKILSALERAGTIVEDGLLVLILTSMILLAAGQIVMRNFFDFGFIWNDELLRLLVLWLAVAGALAASRSDKHINIDVLNRFLSDRASAAVRTVTHLFTAAVCALVAWHSLEFVRTSYAFQDRLLGDVPAWALQAVLPLGFGLIAWRYTVHFARALAGLFRPGSTK